MIKDWKKIVSVVCFCGAMSVMPITAYGDTVENGQASEAAADGEDLPETDDELAADTVTEEEVQEVLRVIDRTSAARYLEETGGAAVQEEEEAVHIDKSMSFRQEIVDYALTFLGGPYRYGGLFWLCPLCAEQCRRYPDPPFLPCPGHPGYPDHG